MINRFLNEFMFDRMQNRTYQKTFDVIICLNSYLKCKLLQAFIFVIHSHDAQSYLMTNLIHKSDLHKTINSFVTCSINSTYLTNLRCEV